MKAEQSVYVGCQGGLPLLAPNRGCLATSEVMGSCPSGKTLLGDRKRSHRCWLTIRALKRSFWPSPAGQKWSRPLIKRLAKLANSLDWNADSDWERLHLDSYFGPASSKSSGAVALVTSSGVVGAGIFTCGSKWRQQKLWVPEFNRSFGRNCSWEMTR